MNSKNLISIIIILWSLFVKYCVARLARVVALFSDRVRDQLNARPDIITEAVALSARRRKFDDCVVFFCSSAGEYEQARPIMDIFESLGNVLCHAFIFSESGKKFIESKREGVSWSMAPLDDAYQWSTLFAALRPSRSVIIRHELWPSFLWVASQWGEIVVANAVVPSMFGRQPKWKDEINILVKSWLCRFVQKFYVVSTSDKEFFERWLRVSARSLIVTGDTKYDRVIARRAQIEKTSGKIREFFREKWKFPGCDLILIGGSVHIPDVTLMLEALRCEELDRIKLLLVPHDISSGNVAKIYDLVKSNKYSCELISEVESKGYDITKDAPRVIIVDEMGRLSDLYSVADFSWIGGAVHAKVHNVLEPGICGLPVSCGTYFGNSQEAVLLHESNLLFASNNPLEVREFWKRFTREYVVLGVETKNLIGSLGGAAQRVANDMRSTSRDKLDSQRAVTI